MAVQGSESDLQAPPRARPVGIGTQDVEAPRRRGLSSQVWLLLLNHLPDSKAPFHPHHSNFPQRKWGKPKRLETTGSPRWGGGNPSFS